MGNSYDSAPQAGTGKTMRCTADSTQALTSLVSPSAETARARPDSPTVKRSESLPDRVGALRTARS
jgi:hypothetical protein